MALLTAVFVFVAEFKEASVDAELPLISVEALEASARAYVALAFLATTKSSSTCSSNWVSKTLAVDKRRPRAAP